MSRSLPNVGIVKLYGITPVIDLTSLDRPMLGNLKDSQVTLCYATAKAGRIAKDLNKFALIWYRGFTSYPASSA